MGQVISLAEATDNNTFISVEQMLADALEDRGKETLVGKHALLLVLDSGPDGFGYRITSRSVNMKRSEMVALCEVFSHAMKRGILA
jgi:hypothetical protein